MKSYTLNTQFTFGKFNGKTLEEVVHIQLSYLEWCTVNLDHFYLSDNVIAQIKELVPSFSLSVDGHRALYEKKASENSSRHTGQDHYDTHDSYGNYDSYEADTFDALTDGQYGSYDDFLEGGGDIDHLRDALGF